jgi:hypothetical protein
MTKIVTYLCNAALKAFGTASPPASRPGFNVSLSSVGGEGWGGEVLALRF